MDTGGCGPRCMKGQFGTPVGVEIKECVAHLKSARLDASAAAKHIKQHVQLPQKRIPLTLGPFPQKCNGLPWQRRKPNLFYSSMQSYRHLGSFRRTQDPLLNSYMTQAWTETYLARGRGQSSPFLKLKNRPTDILHSNAIDSSIKFNRQLHQKRSEKGQLQLFQIISDVKIQAHFQMFSQHNMNFDTSIVDNFMIIFTNTN